MTLLLILIALLVLIVLDIPIAIAIGMVAIAGILSSQGLDGLFNAPLALYEGASSFPLLAIPLFVFAGNLMNASSISRRLIDLANAILGFIRGGLAMVNIGVSLFFAEISGSAVADVAAIGSVLIPAMKEKHYKPSFAAAITSSSASLAIIIPPSIPMILYATLADVSVVKLFVAGILPGVIGGVAMMGLAYYFARKYNLPREAAFRLSRVKIALREAAWTLILPFVILGGIFGGFVTATEGAGLAVAAALFISGVIYRELNQETLWRAIHMSVTQTAIVMLLVATSALLGLYLTEAQLPQQLADSILTLTHNRYAVLLLLNLLLLGLGMLLHGAAAIILVVPMLMPLIHEVGIDPLHFGIVLTLNLAIGQQTPPVASVLITACSIAKVDIWETTRANVPFICLLLALLILVTYFPMIPLALVYLFYG
ncbi:MAG: TRAP transporter large permease [Bacteroidota bacterium]